MDAYALLSSQGWRGTGHSLHKTDDSIGLAKPLLLSRKDNTKGLGTTQHFTSDQWWMNAFDEQLKGLDTSKEGKVVQTVQTGKLNALDKKHLSKYSVYATFVRGGFLEGTISSTETDDSSGAESDNRNYKGAESPKADSEPRKETKEERRARKEEKRKRKEARALRKAARLERKSKKDKAKKDKSDSSDSAKEEKHRRRAKKEEKRRRRELEKNKKNGS